MSDKIFLDTNILVYCLDNNNPVKKKKARELLRHVKKTGQGVISTQVLQEFHVAAVKKMMVDPLLSKEIMTSFSHFEVISVDTEMIIKAVDCQVIHKLSYWDSLIILAAEKSGCGILWSEDLADGALIRNVRILNPFKERKKSDYE